MVKKIRTDKDREYERIRYANRSLEFFQAGGRGW